MELPIGGDKRNHRDRESLVSNCKIPNGSLEGVLRRVSSCSLSEASGGDLDLRCFEKSGKA